MKYYHLLVMDLKFKFVLKWLASGNGQSYNINGIGVSKEFLHDKIESRLVTHMSVSNKVLPILLRNKMKVIIRTIGSPWWRHQMEPFFALLALCEGNSPVTGEFPSLMPVTLTFGVFLDLRLNKWLSKPSRRRWFETPSRHYDVIVMHWTNLALIWIVYVASWKVQSGCSLLCKYNYGTLEIQPTVALIIPNIWYIGLSQSIHRD